MDKTTRSTRTHRITVVLALGAIPLLAACGKEQKAYVATSPSSVQTVAQRNPEFIRAINAYRSEVARAAQLEGAPQDAAIRSSLQLLADAVEKVPQGGGINTVAYAEMIRGSLPTSEMGFAGEDPALSDIRSLQAASTAFGALAGGPYYDSEKVRDSVKAFQGSVRDLQSSEALRIERSRIVGSLRQAEAALLAISNVAVVVPS